MPIKVHHLCVMAWIYLCLMYYTSFSSQLITPESILCSLYPGDIGLDSPNVANHYQLKNVGLGSFGDLAGQLGYPYNWAQRVAGLDFISYNLQDKPGTSHALQVILFIKATILVTKNFLNTLYTL